MSNKPRVVISHDGWLGSEEEDDFQSLILAPMFRDRIDIRGIASTSSRRGGTQRICDTHKILDMYAQGFAKLDAKADGFKRARANSPASAASAGSRGRRCNDVDVGIDLVRVGDEAL